MLAVALAVPAVADEGLWLLNQFPKALVEKKYHFQVTDDFLAKLRIASVRSNSGGSGSFVSPEGPMFTNHHGGNSGSPTTNTKGEINGLLFDGNIEGLPNRFVFTDTQPSPVHVAGQGIVEALRHVYGAAVLLKELGF